MSLISETCNYPYTDAFSRNGIRAKSLIIGGPNINPTYTPFFVS